MRAIINGRSGKLLLSLMVILLSLMAFPNFAIFQSMTEYLGLHSLLELLSIVVAVLVALSVFYSHEKTIPSSYAITGSLFLLSALCDALHVFSYPGMPDLVSPGTMNKAVFFWLIGRSCAIAGSCH
ncbi:MASE3 domain-containing protein [Phytohalomonas tamaricis]|uniref:MASE3 domain-containing protein n=1 Tax=Phytohalomonas tamaricis TaxID=2081032 RepID=UPI000D0B9355|nr:MASE3 domain-containing protein [Phytohalomonas tamaricis]